MKTNWFVAAWLALTSCRPETPTAPSNEDGKAFVALETALKAVAAHRSDINPPPPNGTFVDRRAVTTHERREGNEILGIQTTTSESVERLEEMIMHDNTIGVIYPGALLWGTPFLTKSELHPVLPANRPPQAVTLTGATLTTGQSATFEFDGTYRTFIDTANEVLGTVQMTRALTKMQRSNITDLRSSLLALNMSARFWAGKFDASLEESYQRAASASLISIDRSDFSLTVQPKALAELVRADSLKEAGLLQPAAEDGELIYVRRVTYGRRLLVAVTSTASQADLEKALSFGINGIGVDVDAGIRQKLREISKSMVARMIVIGGEQDEHLNALQSQLIRDPGSLYDVLGAYLEATGARHRASAAVPLSFETAFAIDHTPVASFETAKFAREQAVLLLAGGRDRPHRQYRATTASRMSGWERLRSRLERQHARAGLVQRAARRQGGAADGHLRGARGQRRPQHNRHAPAAFEGLSHSAQRRAPLRSVHWQHRPERAALVQWSRLWFAAVPRRGCIARRAGRGGPRRWQRSRGRSSIGELLDPDPARPRACTADGREALSSYEARATGPDSAGVGAGAEGARPGVEMLGCSAGRGAPASMGLIAT